MLLLFLALSTSVWAKTWCSPTELNLKNCSISSRSLELNIHEKEARVNNGIWHHLRTLEPLEGAQTWQSLGLRPIQNKLFLQAKVWHNSKVLEGIEHLRWLVWEIEGTELNLKINEIIQRRKKIKEDQYITDPLEKHGIKIKDKKIIWWFKLDQHSL